MLMFIGLALLPNIGFWFDTLVYKENFTCWYKPPASDLEDMIQNVLRASVPQLRKKANKLENELKKMDKKPGKDPERQAQLAKELNMAKEALAEAEKKAININVQMHDALVNHSKQIPKMFWLISTVNTGLGLASFIVWDENAFLPLVVYAGLLGLYWTFYPVLFQVGSKPLSATHATLTSLVAGLTTAMFWNEDVVAGILMVPFDLILTYLTLEVSVTSQDEADVRLFISNEMHGRGHG